MEVEFTGRQAEVTDELRALAGAALARIEKLAGKASAANVVFATEKYRHTAEVRILTKLQELIGLCESTSMESALRGALEKAEAQALRQKDKLVTRNHHRANEKPSVEPGLERASHVYRSSLPAANGPGTNAPLAGNGSASSAAGAPRAAVSELAGRDVATHDTEPHIVRTIDAVALRPMSLEEAIKEAEFRNREVFVFRDAGDSGMKVLHRKHDGRMELIELP